MYGTKNRYRKMKKLEKKAPIRKFMVIIISLFITSFILGNFSLIIKADEKREFNTYYSSIKISKDLTIEDIANKYNNTSINTNSEYIEKIKNINSLSSDKLYSGCYLVVECYETLK